MHLNVEFVDTNGKVCRLIVTKEEACNVFEFDLRANIKLFISIEGYSKATYTLKPLQEFGEEMKDSFMLHDKEEKKLQINCNTNRKAAGFRVQFYISNILINKTNLDFLFFYEKPE